MLKKITTLIIIVLVFVFSNNIVFATSNLSLQQKHEAMYNQSLEAEQEENYAEAISNYCEILSEDSDNYEILLRAAKIYLKLGNHTLASNRLSEINMNKITDIQKYEALLIKSQVEISKNHISEAVVLIKKASDIKPNDSIAQIDYSALNYLNNLKKSSESILNKQKPLKNNLPIRSYLTYYLLNMKFGEISDAYKSLAHIAKAIEKNKDDDNSFFNYFMKHQLLLFIAFLPISLNLGFSIFYFIFISSALGFLVVYLTKGPKWHIAVFSAIFTLLAVSSQIICFDRLLLSSLQLNFSISYDYWIIPRLLIAAHILTLISFIFLPLFKLLPESAKPHDTELYAVWFYALFFMIFVCAFQSRISSANRATLMIIGIFFSIICSFFVPMGRFILYQLMNSLGISGIKEALARTDAKTNEVDFSVAKKIQKESDTYIKDERITELIAASKKVYIYHNQETLPALWLNYILALILNENYDEANKEIEKYLTTFSETAQYDKGALLKAYCKCRKGDFPGALSIIQSLKDDQVKDFTKNEKAICLLVLGCCGRFQKEYVQSHIDLGKALNLADYPWLQAEALFESASLDYLMRSKNALQKWNDMALNLKGGNITMTLSKTVQSINSSFNDKNEDAIKLSQEAIDIGLSNSHAMYWHGHLTIKNNKYTAAEEIASKMPLGSYYKDKLIDEITDNKY